MQPHKGDCSGRACLIYPSKKLVVSDESPPDLADFVFRVYRGRLGTHKGKFFVGSCGPLFLTLQVNYMGEPCRLRVGDQLIATRVAGCVGATAIAGPRCVYDLNEVSLVRWTWKPDGFATHSKVFAADRRWLNPQTKYTPQDYALVTEDEDEYLPEEENPPHTQHNTPDWPSPTPPEENHHDEVFVDEEGNPYILESDNTADYEEEVIEILSAEEADFIQEDETYQEDEAEKPLTATESVDKVSPKAQPSDNESYY